MVAPRFEYDIHSLKDMRVNTALTTHGKRIVDNVEIAGRQLKPTARFWHSLSSKFGFSPSIFKYFEHNEVIKRISEKESDARLRVCIENPEDGNGSSLLQAVSSPKKSVARYDDLMDTLTRFNGQNISVGDGLLTSMHIPRVGYQETAISGDVFSNRFTMVTPVDGYGDPSLYLSLLRQICANGMVALAKAYKSTIALGGPDTDPMFSIQRALDGFNNDEGYAALRSQVALAGKSWASLRETYTLHKAIHEVCNNPSALKDESEVVSGGLLDHYMKVRMVKEQAGLEVQTRGTIAGNILYAYRNLTRDPNRRYGLTNIENLAEKKQRIMPVEATVYDLMNFATEVTTHYVRPGFTRGIDLWVGEMLADEYDLAGMAEKHPDFKDFHLTRTVDNIEALQPAMVARN